MKLSKYIEGLDRREFLAFCAKMAFMLGLSEAMIPQIAAAIEGNGKKRRLSVVWLEFQDCCGNTESFTRANAPSAGEALLESISLDYHETLMAAAGSRAEEARDKVLKENSGNVLVVVEGSIPLAENGIYCTIGGRTAEQILKSIEPHALAFVAIGTCSAYGGLPAARPNPTGAVAVSDVIKNTPVINAPGCPANPDVLMGILVHDLVFGRLPALDTDRRPTFAFGKRIHDTCERRPHFDAGQFVENFDDFGAKNGYCLYKVGCKGPETYNICASWRWNEGASWPVKSGHPCIGCSERAFWDRYTPFYGRLPGVQGFGVEASADKIGAVLTGATTAGVLGHVAYTGLMKMAGRSIHKPGPAPQPPESKPDEGKTDKNS